MWKPSARGIHTQGKQLNNRQKSGGFHAVHRGSRPPSQASCPRVPAYLDPQMDPEPQMQSEKKKRSKRGDGVGTQRSRLMNLNTASAAIPARRSAQGVDPCDSKRIKSPKWSSTTCAIPLCRQVRVRVNWQNGLGAGWSLKYGERGSRSLTRNPPRVAPTRSALHGSWGDKGELKQCGDLPPDARVVDVSRWVLCHESGGINSSTVAYPLTKSIFMVICAVRWVCGFTSAAASVFGFRSRDRSLQMGVVLAATKNQTLHPVIETTDREQPYLRRISSSWTHGYNG